ncbi:uncharacterized protein LOC8056429 isoform X1 [Sorghum bicolor]|nr:uncharacterized protein LOC8056429 isoform X1 [Sorghum bicolor]|eukprot:XP_021314338.1 uncharacterized protein LOC8056429 isoform X1 [Sorghum bicolor]
MGIPLGLQRVSASSSRAFQKPWAELGSPHANFNYKSMHSMHPARPRSHPNRNRPKAEGTTRDHRWRRQWRHRAPPPAARARSRDCRRTSCWRRSRAPGRWPPAAPPLSAKPSTQRPTPTRSGPASCPTTSLRSLTRSSPHHRRPRRSCSCGSPTAPSSSPTASRFSEAVELRHYRWLEIGAKIDSMMLSQHTTYAAYIVYKVEENRWHERFTSIFGASKFPKERHDGWMEGEMGGFHNDEGEDGEVSISFRTLPYAKIGLVALGIEIRPKGLLSTSIAGKRVAIWPAFRAPCHLPLLADGEVLQPLASMKALFLRLLDGPVLLADGLTSSWLDKETGGICYMLSARKLSIAWGDNPTYWHWIPITGFRFSEAAELQKAKWLEIRGNIDSKMLSQHTTYSAYIVYMISIDYYGLRALKTFVSLGGRNKSTGHVCLVDGYNYSEHWQVMREYLPEDTHFPQDRGGGGMMEAELGEFHISEGDNGEVSISLMDTFSSKCGLVVMGIEIRPKKQGV